MTKRDADLFALLAAELEPAERSYEWRQIVGLPTPYRYERIVDDTGGKVTVAVTALKPIKVAEQTADGPRVVGIYWISADPVERVVYWTRESYLGWCP